MTDGGGGGYAQEEEWSEPRRLRLCNARSAGTVTGRRDNCVCGING
jgi:hypothetical protein